MRKLMSICSRNSFISAFFVPLVALIGMLTLGALPLAALTLVVTNNSDSGAGSLRQVIITANASTATDTVTFSLGNGARTIAPISALPTISAPLIIDGTTQPGFAGKPLIVLNGTSTSGSGINGLTIQAANCQIKSLIINGFSGAGINIEGVGATENKVSGCYIGTDAVGGAAVPNTSNGITIFRAANNTIGGLTPGERNVISGNANGIDMNGFNSGANSNKIQGNFIGTNAAGNAALPNVNAGVFIEAGAKNNLIGGATATARNVISGNGGNGIIVFDAGTDGNKIQGNYLGTSAAGNVALPNQAVGISVGNGAGRDGIKNTLIGDLAVSPGIAPGNVIAGNNGGGISISGTGTNDTKVQGNLIGTDAAGRVGLNPPGSGAGLAIGAGAQATLVGGTAAGARNVISGNESGISIFGNGPTDNLTVNHLVQGNYIGTNITGDAAIGNRLGVFIVAAKNNFVGGATSALGQTPGNLIAGNREFQVRILGAGATGNRVEGNLIGTNKAGTADLGACLVGVGIDNGAKSNFVGGSAANFRNVISGNETGVRIENAGTDGNKVQGNYLGTNQAGTAAIASTGNGVLIRDTAKNNLIGGIAPTRGQPPGNLISGNGADGVVIVDAGTESNFVQGNLIGTNAAGSAAVANFGSGVRILEGASRNTVGGASVGAGNVLSGNADGIALNSGATANQIQGNLIGTDITGLKALANSGVGVILTTTAEKNIIGGTTSAARNIISGNGFGISINNDGTKENVVQGNFIGVNARGAALGNRVVGIEITSGAFGNLIGARADADDASTRAAANRIAFSGNSGVRVSEETTFNNTLRGNLILGNGGLGINLEPASENPDPNTANAPTPNDGGDGDTGPNHLQNFPVITALSSAAGTTTVSGTLNSRPSTLYVLDFYRNAQGDASGFGEGEIYLGSKRVTTDSSGNVSFTFAATGTFGGTTISATATNLSTGETSEFSPLSLSNVVTNTNDDGLGSLRTALRVAGVVENTPVRFNIPASLAVGGVFTIKPLTPLPFLSRSGTSLDGATQTAFGGNTNAAGPEIVINGGSLGPNEFGPGLTIDGDNCVVRGLVINGFPRGIDIVGSTTNLLASGNKIEGCYIGTTPAGTASAAVANVDDGIRLADDGFTPGTGAANNTIGGLTAATRNVISNNGRYGIVMSAGATSGNVVQSNMIGLNPAGSAPVPNARGIGIFGGAHDNIIGGTVPAAANSLFANGDVGVVLISDAGTKGNKVQGNVIGLNKAGTAPLTTGADVPDIFGIRVLDGAQSNLIGGVGAGGNFIGGLTNGIGISGTGANGNLIQGNSLGLGANGTLAIPNLGNGIIIGSGAQNNVIGAARGATGAAIAGAGNRIANSAGGDGVRVFAGPTEQTIGNTIRGNSIYNSDGLGINLFAATEAEATVTPNDVRDGDSGPNRLQNFPLISTITVGSSNTTISGTFNSTPNQNFVLDFYQSPDDGSACSGGGNVAEGRFYVASQNITTGADGSATFSLGVSNSIGQVFTVTSTNLGTGDTSEFSPTPLVGGASEVTNTRDIGPGSLRAALLSVGSCTGDITLNIPQSDAGFNATTKVFTIQLASPLPFLANSDTILDGTTQPGFAGRPLVFLNGSGAGAGATGIGITGANCVLKGLIISGFKGRQVSISGAGATGNVVLNCYIGTDASGRAGIAGSGAGIVISGGARNTKIGGTAAGEANRIAFSGGEGVLISDNSSGNTVRGNRIYRNGALGLNLSGGVQDGRGVTSNDAGDADSGANNLQNYPLLSGLRLSGTSAVSGTVSVALNSRPSDSFALDFYRVTAPDPSGFGEGEFYLGSRTITTDASGNYSGNLSFSLGSNFAEQSLSATATNLSSGDTSEFGPSQMLVGTVNAWGYNNLGQLGDGSTANKLLAQAVALNGVVAVAAGGAHSVAVTSDGTVWSWGNNGSGQLGDGTGTNRLIPVQVPGLFEVQAVAAGWYHSLALKRDGTVVSWGSNSFGQLGDGSNLVSTLPRPVTGLRGVIAITAGVYYSVALKSDGTVWCWGSNFYGQLGDGTTTDRTIPVQIKGVSGIRAIGAGAGHTVLLKSDGSVQTLGWNANGQLGNGTTTNSLVPLTVKGISGAGLIAAGYAHTLAAPTSGSGISAWGSNTAGQIGDGTTGGNRLSPVQVANLSGVRALAAGTSHSLAVKSDGTLWSWGNNPYGAIGDGTTTNRNAPVQTVGLGNIGAVSGGFSHSLALGSRAGTVLARAAPFRWLSVTANASPESVQLRSAVALDRAVAADARHYEVLVGGVSVAIQSASYNATGNTVTLKFAPRALKDGSQVVVSWRGLRDAKTQALSDGNQKAVELTGTL